MKIGLVAIGTLGDVLPLVRLGERYAAEGHEVCVFASEAFERLVREAKLDFASLGAARDYYLACEQPLFDVDDGWRYVREGLIEPQSKQLQRYALSDYHLVASPHLGVPVATTVYVQPYAALAFPPDERSIALFPDWFAFDLAFEQYLGFPDAECGSALPDSLLEGLDRPVCVTFGTGNSHAGDLIAEACEALHDIEHDAIVVTRYADRLPELPARCRVVEQVPLRTLLRGCSAIIHHGGIGTIAAAHSARCKQFIVPLAHDQFDNAARAQRTMGARVVERSKLREQLGEALA